MDGQGRAPSAQQDGAVAGGSGSLQQQLYAQLALGEELRKFWEQATQEVEEHSEVLADFKNQALPLARIKKIMKSDEDVRMISAEAPVLFARACEFFIQELTMRSWSAAGEFKRRTMQRSDVATAIARTDIFDFLVDVVPREETNDQLHEGTLVPLPAAPPQPQQAQQAQAQFLLDYGGAQQQQPGMLQPFGNPYGMGMQPMPYSSYPPNQYQQARQ